MKKFLLVYISLVISLLQPCLQSAHAQDVESFVRDFYKWYLKQSLSFVKQPQPLFEKLPVFDQDIFKYVCRCTAKRVQFDYKRGVSGSGGDYYLRSNDVIDEQLKNMKVGKSISVNDKLLLVPVSTGFRKEYEPHVVVYVEKINGRMCISKVEDSRWPNFRAPVY